MAEQQTAQESRSTIFPDLSKVGENLRKLAAQYIDFNERIAKQAIEFSARATEWAKETPLAQVFEAQRKFNERLVEGSVKAARNLFRIEDAN